jgi:carbohydrate-binding DOMON domain-containing protein
MYGGKKNPAYKYTKQKQKQKTQKRTKKQNKTKTKTKTKKKKNTKETFSILPPLSHLHPTSLSPPHILLLRVQAQLMAAGRGRRS